MVIQNIYSYDIILSSQTDFVSGCAAHFGSYFMKYNLTKIIFAPK